MKNFFLIAVILLPSVLFAQTNVQGEQEGVEQAGNIQAHAETVHDSTRVTAPVLGAPEKCKDCDEVKQAIRAAHGGSSGKHSRRSHTIKSRSARFSARMDMKMKRIFSHRKKIRTYYDICFGGH